VRRAPPGWAVAAPLALLLVPLPGGAAPRREHHPVTSPPGNPAATQAQIEAAERDRAARVAAQQAAAAEVQAAAEQEQRLAQARIDAAARLRDTETRVADAATRMDALSREQAAAEAALRSRAAQLEPLLPLIERLSLYPAETLLAAPEPPERALRAVLVLRGISRRLEEDAAALRAEQQRLAGLREAIAAATPALDAALAAQASQAAELDRQIAQARQGQAAAGDLAADAARQAAADGARADTLRGVLAQIDADRRDAAAKAAEDARATAEAAARQQAGALAAQRAQQATEAAARQQALDRPAGPGLASPAGQIAPPVTGQVVRGFGDATDAGPAQGVSYRPPPGAHVVAPCSGKVVFAAPFRSYGLLLILDCGQSYHFVLAGLDRIDVQVGRAVQAGEPVGVMPAWDPRTPGPRPDLYVELRRDGVPINPAPWLRASGLRTAH
jgi:septal ring factor EnvC (AmiA/AmiB activator)